MDHEALEVLVGAGKEGCAKRFREYLERTEVCGVYVPKVTLFES
jgi:hypothetical protein